MRIEDAATTLGVSIPTIHEWADSGYLVRTGYFGDYFISDESVRKFAKSIARYEARKAERTARKDRKKALPDYFLRLEEISGILGLPIHQTRLLAQAKVFDARKVDRWWVMDGGQANLFVMEHQDNGKTYNTAAKIIAQIQEDNGG